MGRFHYRQGKIYQAQYYAAMQTYSNYPDLDTRIVPQQHQLSTNNKQQAYQHLRALVCSIHVMKCHCWIMLGGCACVISLLDHDRM